MDAHRLTYRGVDVFQRVEDYAEFYDDGVHATLQLEPDMTWSLDIWDPHIPDDSLAWQDGSGGFTSVVAAVDAWLDGTLRW